VVQGWETGTGHLKARSVFPAERASSSKGETAMARMSAAERRALLVEAAIVVMSREGVAHTTTRAAVAGAGMQSGVVHYCSRLTQHALRQPGEEVRWRRSTPATRRTDDPVAAGHLAEHLCADAGPDPATDRPER
jgi:hypothetical protein